MISKTTAKTDESILDQFLDEIIQRIRAGEKVDVDQLALGFPHVAKRLRQIIPAIEAIAQWDPSGHEMERLEVDAPCNETLGDFRIVRQIGRGGMGVVYEAEQLSVNRRVALKVLPLASLFDKRALQRFHNEVRAAAALEHPNIVSVISAGEERGVHYYAMQLIRGRSLAAVIKELKLLADKGELGRDSIHQVLRSETDANDSSASGCDLVHSAPTKPVETVARAKSATVSANVNPSFFKNVARLAIQTARALQHAHDQGVIHRDIKPGNLMIDDQGDVHVTDFGLARIETDAGMTMSGDVVGTLRYMSPEQVLAQRTVIDHRSDIYSLGATVFELLTLEPLHRGDNRAEIIKQISLQDPRSLRSIHRDIPLELDTILLKSLDRDPGGRYQTAADFADDLQRYLNNQPIRARRATVVDSAGKWCRRNATFIWTGLVCAIIALSVGAAAAWQQMQIAQREAETSQRRLEMAMGILDEFLFSSSAQALMKQRHGDATDETRGRTEVYNQLLRKATPLYEQIAREAALSENTEGYISALLQVARAQQDQFAHDSALETAQLAESLSRQYDKLHPGDPVAQRHLGISLAIQATEYFRTGDRPQALQTSAAAARQLQVVKHVFSADNRFRRDFAEVCSLQALMLVATERFDESLPVVELAMQEVESLAGSSPADPNLSDFLAWLYFFRGELLYRSGDRTAATASFEQELILRERQYKAGIDQYLPWFLVACAEQNLRDIPRAVELGKRHELPHVLGLAEYQLENWDAAKRQLLQANELEEDGFTLGQTRLFLSMTCARLGELSEAREWYEKALESNRTVIFTNPLEFSRFRRQALNLLEEAENKRP